MKWDKNESLDLVNACKRCKDLDLPISNAFTLHGKKYCRTFASVKKHYYDKLNNNMFDNIVKIDSYQNAKINEKYLQALFRGLVKLVQEQMQGDNNGT